MSETTNREAAIKRFLKEVDRVMKGQSKIMSYELELPYTRKEREERDDAKT